MTKQSQIIRDILDERLRQDKKWGIQHHNAVEWLAILTEEIGESAKECVQIFVDNERATLEMSMLRFELVHCAAVVVAWIEDIDGVEDEISNLELERVAEPE